MFTIAILDISRRVQNNERNSKKKCGQKICTFYPSTTGKHIEIQKWRNMPQGNGSRQIISIGVWLLFSAGNGLTFFEPSSMNHHRAGLRNKLMNWRKKSDPFAYPNGLLNHFFQSAHFIYTDKILVQFLEETINFLFPQVERTYATYEDSLRKQVSHTGHKIKSETPFCWTTVNALRFCKWPSYHSWSSL